jgi:cytochrome c oxidase assembly factor CtaG
MLSKVISHKLKGISKVIVLTFAFCLLPFASNSQCAMCRASLQNEANKATAEGVNDGIVYLMAIPYILVAGVFYAVWRLKQKKKEQVSS